jgi:DNA-binding NarL/FixJ family response regulator
MMRILLLVADQMMCDGLRALLQREPEAEVVAQSEDGPEALELVRQLHPDLVLADITSWASSSFDTVQQIARELPNIRVVALSTFTNRTFVAEAFRRGVHGYVLKQDGFAELIQAIRTVTRGDTYLCSRATQDILDLTIPAPSNLGGALETTLSDRECIILQMLSEGRTSKEIALALDVSSKTIDACRRQLMRKLGVDSIAGLVKRALALGLTTLST